MMTFKEYLIESNIMSRDALMQAMSDYGHRGMGMKDGSKPKDKRIKQMDTRKDRKAGHPREEEMEQKMPGVRDKVVGIQATPKEDKYSRPRSHRAGQRAARNLRRRWGQGGERTNSKSYAFDD